MFLTEKIQEKIKVVEIPPGGSLGMSTSARACEHKGVRACSQSFIIPATWECKKFDIF